MGHGELGAPPYNGGLGAEPPAGSRGRCRSPPSQGVTGRSGAPWSRGPGAEPLLRGQGRSPLKLKALKHLHTYKEGPKFADNMPSPSWHWQLGNRHNHHDLAHSGRSLQRGPGAGVRDQGALLP